MTSWYCMWIWNKGRFKTTFNYPFCKVKSASHINLCQKHVTLKRNWKQTKIQFLANIEKEIHIPTPLIFLGFSGRLWSPSGLSCKSHFHIHRYSGDEGCLWAQISSLKIHLKNLGPSTEVLQGEYLKNGFLHACSAPKIKNNLSSSWIENHTYTTSYYTNISAINGFHKFFFAHHISMITIMGL